ncbi:MAG: peptide chain release factor N(5)-glutamine methyltransferase, partial [Smithellaceae bacterium]
MFVQDILHETARNFADAGIPSARLDAEILLACCLSCDRINFIKNPQTPVDAETLAAFRQLAARRLAWEPVAYITGRKE